MKYLFTYDLRRRNERLIRFANNLLDETIAEMNNPLTPEQNAELRQRIIIRVTDEENLRYNHNEINTAINEFIEENNWQLHPIELSTSFLFEAPDMAIEDMRQMLIEAEIIDERIFNTDNYMLVKIASDENYHLN